MIKLVNDVEKLITEEVTRANNANPPFHSGHEGIAVIEEEVLEAEDEHKIVRELFEAAKRAVFKDCKDEANYHVMDMRETVVLQIAELIQVAAMCDKFTGQETSPCQRMREGW